MTEIIDPAIKMIVEPVVEPVVGHVVEPRVDNEIPPKKPRKPKKKMSEHHKAKCVESLKKAREASAIKRKEKAEYKKIMKKKADDEMKEIINNSRALDKESNDEKDKIILRLQKQLNSLTLNDVISKPKPKKRPVKKMETIIEDNEGNHEDVQELPKQCKQQPVLKAEPIKKPMKQKIQSKPIPYKCKRVNKASKYF
tara:strand:- start:9113 stop:9703 length:591 start_codon:yes stop_codon:yes gene_type:complete